MASARVRLLSTPAKQRDLQYSTVISSIQENVTSTECREEKMNAIYELVLRGRMKQEYNDENSKAMAGEVGDCIGGGVREVQVKETVTA